jgi:hypothetical protein
METEQYTGEWKVGGWKNKESNQKVPRI